MTYVIRQGFASYSKASGGLTASLGDPSKNTGDAVGDVYPGISSLEGSAFDDVLIGNASDNRLAGGLGADRLEGSSGLDQASYQFSAGPLTASLADPALNTGEAAGDTYVDIEGLVGSAFDDTLTGTAGDNVLEGGAGADHLDGGSGSGDYASYRNSPIGLTVSLANPSANTGEASGDTYVSIERVDGSAFDDVLIGDGADNVLRGNGGADQLDGGAGFDHASYFYASASIKASLADPSLNTGEAAGDVYVSIEALSGSAFDDVLIGDGATNFLTGQAGADNLNGGGGFDYASYANSLVGLTVSFLDRRSNTGEAAGDTYVSIEGLQGSSFNDVLTGDSATNVLRGGGGADSLDGAGGFDYASYFSSAVGVTASLADTSLNTGEAAGDVYVSIEGLQGSNFADTLIGNAADNFFYDYAGNDAVIAGAGRDTFISGAGDDSYYGGGKAAGTGLDGSTDAVDYSQTIGLTQGIVVNWAAGTVVGQAGLIGTDQLFQIETIFGTAFDDKFDATGYSASLAHAGDFSGYQFIRGGAGNDTIIGNFNTEAAYTDATSAIVATMTAFGTGTVTGGGLGSDKLTGVNRIVGSVFDDSFVGSDGSEIFDGYRGGNDTFNGAGGADTVEYDGAADNSPLNVKLAAGVVTDRFGATLIGADTLVSIEQIRGSESDDLYDATDFSDKSVNAGSFGTFNQFEGQGGADTVIGNGNTRLAYFSASGPVTVLMSEAGTGTATAIYGASFATDTFSGVNRISGSGVGDSFVGSNGDDYFEGRDGNDTLEGRAGADQLDGGNGSDTAAYERSTTGVTASLAAPSSNTGDAAGDTYVSIENLKGTTRADVLIGDDAANILFGWDGNDDLDGGAGLDVALNNWAKAHTILTDNHDGTWTMVGPDGTDTLRNIEIVRFSDGDVFVGATTVSIAAIGAATAEGNSGTTAFSFTVSLSQAVASDRTVSWAVSGSGASPSDAADFGGMLPSGNLVFAAGETSKTVTVMVSADGAVELDESFAVTLSNPSSGLTIGTASAVGTIVNDDSSVSIAALSAATAEGQSGQTSFTFTLTLTGDSSVSRSVSYGVAGSGAAPADGADFVGGVEPTGTVTFAVGETSKTISLDVAADSVVEEDEAFTVTLSNPSSGLVLGTTSAVGTIENDDAIVSIAATSASMPEGSSGATAFTFTVTQSGDTNVSHTVAWAVVGTGSNPAGASDFAGDVLPTGTVTFAVGETSKVVTVSVAGDTIVEADEGFAVTLSDPSAGLAIGMASASGTIQNDDRSTVSVAPLAVTKVEGNVGFTSFTFTAALDWASTSAQTVEWAVFGSGIHPADISDFEGRKNLPAGTLTFAPGETSKTITVSVVGDTRGEFYPGYQFDEPDEQFTIALSEPSPGLLIGAGEATGFILTDDIPSVVFSGFHKVSEGDSGHTAYPFFVFYFGDRSTTRSVSWTVSGSGDDAADASDFVNQVFPSGTLTFAPEEILKVINVPLSGDTVVEPDESFTVTLSTVSSGVAIGSAIGTISDDDIVAAVTDVYVLLQNRPLTMADTAGVLVNDKSASVASLLAAPQHGALQLHGDGAFGYTPDHGYFGIDSFSYRAGNLEGSADAQALLYVVPVLEGETTTTLNLLALDAEQQIASTYVAFFGRGADAGGFGFWLDEFEAGLPTRGPAVLFADIASSFANSLEAKALHPFLADHPFEASDGQIADFLEGVYDNLFNRLPDADGLAYWTGQVKQTLASGRYVGSVLVDIMSGAQDTTAGQDITTLMSKVAVGLAYVHEQQERHTVWAEASDVAAATELIGAVTADPASVLVGVRNAELLIAEHA